MNNSNLTFKELTDFSLLLENQEAIKKVLNNLLEEYKLKNEEQKKELDFVNDKVKVYEALEQI